MINNQTYANQDFKQAMGSLMITFIIVIMPLIAYVIIGNLDLARMISVMTGLVLLFVFGVHRAQLEYGISPLRYGFSMALVGAVCACSFYYLANFFKIKNYCFKNSFILKGGENMSTNFLSNINWSSPTTIGIGIGIVAVIVIAGYLIWAWQEKKPPFDNM